MTTEGQASTQPGSSRPRQFRRSRRIPPPKDPATVSFLCDVMLGKLARELRLLGIDCEYERNLGGMAAYRVARQRGRILLSRANRLRELPGVLPISAGAVADEVAQVKDAIAKGLAPAVPVAEPEPPHEGRRVEGEGVKEEPTAVAPTAPVPGRPAKPQPVAVERRPPAQRRQPEPAQKVEERGTRCVTCNVPLEKITREQARPLVPFFVYQIHYDFKRCPKCKKVFWPGDHVAQIQQRHEARPGRRRAGRHRGARFAG
jgi:uncharacterized protein with PIN domain